MRIDCFLNTCENIEEFEVRWFSDFSVQKATFSKWKGQVSASCNNAMESFLDSCKGLFDTAEYQLYQDHRPLCLLKQLYDLIEKNWYEQDSLETEEEKLLKNSKWIEVRDFAIQTKGALRAFIDEERKKDPSYER